MAPSRLASASTLSSGTKWNSASLSMNFLISQGQATRSTFTRSRVIHFMGQLLQCGDGARKPLRQRRRGRKFADDARAFCPSMRNLLEKSSVAQRLDDLPSDGETAYPRNYRRLANRTCCHKFDLRRRRAFDFLGCRAG